MKILYMDLCEYSSDALAQAAFVSSDGYGSDILNDGTASASSENASFLAPKAVDNLLAGSRWITQVNQNTGWWKYDLGVGVTKTVRKFRYIGEHNNQQIKDFTLQGSNDDSNYDVLLTQTAASSQAWQEWTFANSTAYRYYKIVWTSIITVDNYAGALEMEMMEMISSLNDTLTKTLTDYLDYSIMDKIIFQIRASRTGTNIQLQIENNTYSSDKIPDMTSNVLPSGVASADDETVGYEAWKAMNDSNIDGADCWHSLTNTLPHYLQYQFTSGKIIRRYTITARNQVANKQYPVDWTLQGSNNGSDWTTLDTQTSQSFIQAEKKTYSFSNTVSYTYYKLNITDSENSTYAVIGEFELIEKPLSTHNVNIASADTWQTESWDISAIATANRDKIDKIIIKIIDASADNVIYIDNLYSEAVIEHSYPWIG